MINHSSLWASPPASEATPNRAMPAMNIRRRPKKSATNFTEIALEAEQIEAPWLAIETLIRRSAEEVEGDSGFQLAMMGSDELHWEGIEEEKAAFAAPASRIIERAKAAGALRSDFGFEDFPMLMCGITSTMYFRPAGSDWRRHVEFVLAGLRPT